MSKSRNVLNCSIALGGYIGGSSEVRYRELYESFKSLYTEATIRDAIILILDEGYASIKWTGKRVNLN